MGPCGAVVWLAQISAIQNITMFRPRQTKHNTYVISDTVFRWSRVKRAYHYKTYRQIRTLLLCTHAPICVSRKINGNEM